MHFTAVIEQTGKTTTGIPVPHDVIVSLDAGKRPAVRVTINGHTYRTSVGVMGGRSLIPVSADVRRITNIAANDEIDLGIELDTEPRDLAVPADLAAALATDLQAREFFETLSYSNRRRIVLSIDSAKTPETRRRRITKAIAALAERRST